MNDRVLAHPQIAAPVCCRPVSAGFGVRLERGGSVVNGWGTNDLVNRDGHGPPRLEGLNTAHSDLPIGRSHGTVI